MGRPRNEKTTRLVQTTVEEGVYKELLYWSASEDRPVASVIRQAISKYLAYLQLREKADQ